MHTKLVALLVSGGLATGFATDLRAQAAEEKGWYGGVAVGTAWVKIKDDALAITGSTASSLSKDESAGTFALAVGYDFSRNWAVEAGYANNGKFGARRTSTAPVAGTASATVETSAWTLQAVGKMPLADQFYLFGKGGVAQTRASTSITTTGGVALAAGTNNNPKRSKASFVLGGGIGYDFSRSIGVRLDYTHLFDVGNNDTGKGDVGAWTIGLKYRF